MTYAELHCHSYYSFHDGASSIEELVLRAKEMGYAALALTDHDNLCAALEFARCARAWGLQPIIGAELTLQSGYHLTLLAEDHQGYSNLCRLISLSHVQGGRRDPALDPALLAEHAKGIIALSGCYQGQIPSLLEQEQREEAGVLARQYQEWLGGGNFYLELQNNLCYGDKKRNRQLASLGRELGIPVVATGNAHYHVRERHRLQDALVAIRHCKTLEETHRERRPNSEFFLRPPSEMAELFAWRPEAIRNTMEIARRCAFDPSRDLDYRFPDSPVPEGHTADSYLEELCYQAAVRRYGGQALQDQGSRVKGQEIRSTLDSRPSALTVRERLEEELRLIRKHGLSGFFLIYHEILKLAREVAVELGLSHPDTPLEEDPPGRSRGSSVCLLVGYLIGLSHIDPLKYNLSLERFLHEDLSRVPDVDLDFPRNIREGLIVKVHRKWGWQYAALTGMFSTYKIRGAVRDLGKALGLPEDEVDRLAKRVEHRSAKHLAEEMEALPDFKDKMAAPLWQHLIDLARELDGFPRYLAQHPGGMVISSRPLIDLVPVQPAAMEGRYICQWDKDSVQDASFIKIDFLALGALSQVQECQGLILKRHGLSIDLSRLDYHDPAVYDMLCRGDTIGVFQVESAAQLQTIGRLRPRDLVDMAIEVALVRPGVGATGSTRSYLARRTGKEPIAYDHPLEKRALERTLGAIVFQDQVNQLAIDVAGFSGDQADHLRRAFSRRNNQSLLQACWEKFRDGAAGRGVPEEAAMKIFSKFNGQYMFPESHAYAFGVTAYQASWLKRYYPLEFYVALFNQQPMGFYNLESLKEDARKHGIAVLNPDVNLSWEKCVIDEGLGFRVQSTGEEPRFRLGLLNVRSVGEVAAGKVVAERDANGPYRSLGDLMERMSRYRTIMRTEEIEEITGCGSHTCSAGACPPLPSGGDQAASGGKRGTTGLSTPAHLFNPDNCAVSGPPAGLLRKALENLAEAGALDAFGPDRRLLRWEIGLRYRPPSPQLALSLPVTQDLAPLPELSTWEKMEGEYRTMSLYPNGHLIATLRPSLPRRVTTSHEVQSLADGVEVVVAGLVIRRQRPGTASGVIFLTLEDEFGHIPCVVWPQIYRRYRARIKESVLLARGNVSRRDGTMNVVVQHVEAVRTTGQTPRSKDWG